jgi:hypothetical protein
MGSASVVKGTRMSTRAEALSGEARLLAFVGLSLWLFAGLAEIWEVLAFQAPDSPFHLGVLSGPVGQLRSHSFGLGCMALILAWLWPKLAAPGEARWILGCLLAGALLELLALSWAASRGMLAVQVFDPRPDARSMLYARALGHGLCLIAGVGLWLRALGKLRRA